MPGLVALMLCTASSIVECTENSFKAGRVIVPFKSLAETVQNELHSIRCILKSFFDSFFPFIILYVVRKSQELIQESNSRLWHPSDILALGIRVVKSFAASPPHWLR